MIKVKKLGLVFDVFFSREINFWHRLLPNTIFCEMKVGEKAFIYSTENCFGGNEKTFIE